MKKLFTTVIALLLPMLASAQHYSVIGLILKVILVILLYPAAL